VLAVQVKPLLDSAELAAIHPTEWFLLEVAVVVAALVQTAILAIVVAQLAEQVGFLKQEVALAQPVIRGLLEVAVALRMLLVELGIPQGAEEVALQQVQELLVVLVMVALAYLAVEAGLVIFQAAQPLMVLMVGQV
jgi:hypothetical protein